MRRIEADKRKDDWYTSLTDIQIEMDRRFTDESLYKKILKLWGGDLPSFIKKNQKYAVLSRTIFTPNNELFYFLDMCELLNLTPLLLEYPVGKFVAKNPEKYNLAKLSFFQGFGKKYGIKIERLNIVNFNTQEGERMGEVKTIFNEKLIDFHHDVLGIVNNNLSKNIVDFSDWFDKHKVKEEGYYFYFLSLFIRNAVLFENFIDSDNEEIKFTNKKFKPSFYNVCNFFGLKPLIYPLLPLENEKSHSWYCYGHAAKNIIFDKLKKIDDL